LAAIQAASHQAQEKPEREEQPLKAPAGGEPALEEEIRKLPADITRLTRSEPHLGQRV